VLPRISDPIIAEGPDGNIWFTETAGNLSFAKTAAGKIGRLALSPGNRLPIEALPATLSHGP
jgi:hypothetical protein